MMSRATTMMMSRATSRSSLERSTPRRDRRARVRRPRASHRIDRARTTASRGARVVARSARIHRSIRFDSTRARAALDDATTADGDSTRAPTAHGPRAGGAHRARDEIRGGGAAAGEHDGEDGASTTRTKAREGWSAATRARMNE
jgi:hypothetical protein